LDNDHDYIFKAASEAQKAVDYLHSLQSSQLEEAA
jgi:antirestriction protein ArdC